LLELPDDFAGAVDTGVAGQCDIGALSPEFSHQPLAKASTATGNQDHLIGQTHSFAPSSLLQFRMIWYRTVGQTSKGIHLPTCRNNAAAASRRRHGGLRPAPAATV
jgi:hypothetical protein